MFLGNDNKAYT